MALKFHVGYPGNRNAHKVLIAAEYVGVEIVTPEGFQMGVTNTTPEFLKLNPLGKIPLLETPEGSVFESSAIARYVARLKPEAGLYGKSNIDAAHVDQWIDFATNEIDINQVKILGGRLGFAQVVYTAKGEEVALAQLKRAYGALDKFLASTTYLVGDAVTLADIVLVPALALGFKYALAKDLTAGLPHLLRYVNTLVNQPAFKKVLGELTFWEAPLPSPPAEGQIASRQGPPAAAKPVPPPAAAKEVAPPPQASAAGPSTPAPAAAALGDEEEDAPKKKPKNVLDLLPPSPMVLDNWKRLYSNTKAKDFAEVAIKGFWDMYDPEGYSLWFSDYKYNEENTVSYVTMNKVGGFLQRMDPFRKYSFAKIGILGKEPPFKIKGVWLFRGTEFPQPVKDECYDAELYEWTKVDINDPAQKALVNAYFEEPDDILGEKLVEAKCFK